MGKHGAIISDLHCGHKFGLCPPDHWEPESDDPTQAKVRQWQMRTWEWYAAKAKALGHLDRLIVNGDAIDGSGDRSGGTELFTTDRHLQVKVAADCIRQFDAEAYTIIRGTAYHVGDKEDFEDTLAERFGTHAQDHAWLEYAGCVIDCKHHLGSSTVPGAVPPSLPREAVWNLMWAERDLQPKANVFIRSHLHAHYEISTEDFLCIVTPALQGWTKYGGRRMSKTVSYGLIEWWISDQGAFTWKRHILRPVFAAAKAEAI